MLVSGRESLSGPGEHSLDDSGYRLFPVSRFFKISGQGVQGLALRLSYSDVVDRKAIRIFRDNGTFTGAILFMVLFSHLFYLINQW